MPEHPLDIPAMAVTIELDGAPTVRVAYDGNWRGGSIIRSTSITIGEQAMASTPGYLLDLLLDAGSLLILYAARHKEWPADLRPAPCVDDELDEIPDDEAE